MTKASPGQRKAYIITGPTSGIGRSTALELAKYGTVVLVGRDQGKLDEMQQTIERTGPACGAGRVRLVGSRERAARGRGDHRARASARGPGQ